MQWECITWRACVPKELDTCQLWNIARSVMGICKDLRCGTLPGDMLVLFKTALIADMSCYGLLRYLMV